jgi:hypothetical protein
MLKHQLEGWALDVLDRVASGGRLEDSRVEIKREWPDPVEAARRIAGHANAARGAPILWLIGVDEKARTIPGADYKELANWFPRLQSQFDELAPSLQDLNVPYKGVTVIALISKLTGHRLWSRIPAEGPSTGRCPGGREQRHALLAGRTWCGCYLDCNRCLTSSFLQQP